MKYYLDTNICVYYIKGKYPKLLEKLLSKHPNDIKIPAIVKAELIYGAQKSERKENNEEVIRKFLLPFEIIAFGDKQSEIYGKIRADLEKKGEIIGPNDLLIASIVLSEDGILVTNNEKELKKVKELKIENWVRN
ncbi:MAG TPA: type II toxin-antitoxin system VapC family toxin [bacterium]|nr:type II toxin-antitoxin system VapC family toxin [bacterium]